MRNREQTRRKLRYSIKTTVLIAFKNFGASKMPRNYERRRKRSPREARVTFNFLPFFSAIYFSDRAIIASDNNGSRNPSIVPSSTRRYNVNLRDLNYFRLQRGHCSQWTFEHPPASLPFLLLCPCMHMVSYLSFFARMKSVHAARPQAT